jgi:hypothetical protein
LECTDAIRWLMAKEIVVVGVEDDSEEICFVEGVLLSRD